MEPLKKIGLLLQCKAIADNCKKDCESNEEIERLDSLIQDIDKTIKEAEVKYMVEYLSKQ